MASIHEINTLVAVSHFEMVLVCEGLSKVIVSEFRFCKDHEGSSMLYSSCVASLEVARELHLGPVACGFRQAAAD